MSRRVRAIAAVALLAAPVVIAACGGSDSAGSASSEFCAAWRKVNDSDTGAHGGDPAAITQPAAMKKTWTGSVALAEELRTNAPAAILDDVTVVVENLIAQNKVMAANGYDITAMSKDPKVRTQMDALAGDAAVVKAKANYVKFADDACGTSYATS